MYLLMSQNAFHVAHFCTKIHDYNQTHMKAEKICYKMGIANEVCSMGVN